MSSCRPGVSEVAAADVEPAPPACEGRLVAFRQLAEQRRAQLLWQAQRMTKNREEAEDIVQEALLKAFKNLPKFRGESQMGTWLGAIVQNAGREWLRRQKGRVYLSLEYVSNGDVGPRVYDCPDPGRNPEQHLERAEMDSILISEIDKLNSTCRCAIQLCALQEISHQEVANALGLTVVAIKSRVFHGKQMLKTAVRRRTGN